MTKKVAVIPAAGDGTRIMGVGGNGPKEMITVGDRPAINYIVADLVSAGIEEIIVVTSHRKPNLNDWLSGQDDRIPRWQANGKSLPITHCSEISQNVEVTFVYQEEPLGLGDAVNRAKAAVGDRSFLVRLPDDLYLPRGIKMTSDTSAKRFIEIGDLGDNAILTMPVAVKDQSKYGMVEYEVSEGDLRSVVGMHEKPEPDAARQCEAAVGLYVFQPEFFDYLARISKGVGGEMQLTEAIELLIADSMKTGIDFGMASISDSELRFDLGQPEGHELAQRHVYQLKDSGLILPSVAQAREQFSTDLSDIVKR